VPNLQQLLQVLKDRQNFGSNARLGAFKALCELGDKNAVPHLIAFYLERGFSDEGYETTRLFNALDRIGDAKAVDFLVQEIEKFSA
jgi:HEAT repeat protein